MTKTSEQLITELLKKAKELRFNVTRANMDEKFFSTHSELFPPDGEHAEAWFSLSFDEKRKLTGEKSDSEIYAREMGKLSQQQAAGTDQKPASDKE